MMSRPHVPACLALILAGAAWAYPEFHTFIEQHSGRTANCAMCHTHADGPEGLKPGQIGSLDAAQFERLNQSRGAFEPGLDIDSPILNAFGDSIMYQLGKQQFLQVRQDPAKLAEVLDPNQDLDGDGIPDAEEYLAGTLPIDPYHGDPWRLFVINLQRRWFDIFMIILATAAGLYGLHNLLLGFERLGARTTARGNSEN